MTTWLDALFDPRSVAVVGASDNPEKWGYWLAAGALAGRAPRGAPPVHLDAAAAALCALSRAAAEHPELSELEVNPLLVHPGGAVALKHTVYGPRPRSAV
ncbi:acetate--CoA ligase family protein [Streptomyces sp. NBC_01481]|uniref:acetate--CoA ligase family protein n=1 Tax=Streptomyces sp. NBC_01481 TaxID=2975869 RepID=UPI0022586239|nr:acetate--CoA ligase family protein [Streptomyces sp. NBC_01481]MCX4585334.1 acetate--CoA ligase family protein [Streptomyces sp. NBC_01481]